MDKLRVNLISESAFTIKGHGVHTAFIEMLEALSGQRYVDVEANTLRRADVTHIHTVGLYALLVLITTKNAKVISAHVMPESFVGSLVGAKHWYGFAKWYLRHFYNRGDAVLAVSQEVHDQLRDLGVKKPVFVVPNTIKVDRYRLPKAQVSQFRNDMGYKVNDFIVIAVGQVQPRKRVDSFVATAQKLPDVKFIWVGGIPFKHAAADYDYMKKLMQNAPANLAFVGEVDHTLIPKYYAISNLFFLPSEQETFGIVIAEAAAARLPLLLRDLDQYKVTFRQNYAVGDDESFVLQIRKIRRDADYRRQLIQKSQHIATMYDSEAMMGRLIDIYTEVIKTKKGL